MNVAIAIEMKCARSEIIKSNPLVGLTVSALPVGDVTHSIKIKHIPNANSPCKHFVVPFSKHIAVGS